jgi:ABC-type molybdate transport system substrate-binding protein
MITVDTWKNLPKVLRRMVKGLIAKKNCMKAMAYRSTDMTISTTVPKDIENEQAKQFTGMIERSKGKVVAPREKRLQ